jgi:sulfur-oxidizing protein SoxY
MSSRRDFLSTSAGLMAVILVRTADAQTSDPTLATLMRDYAGNTAPRIGRVKIDIAPLVDNGNSVPITVSVESPMTSDNHVTGIGIFNEKNPQHDVAKFVLTPRNGIARVSTRIRLATSQKLVAIARMNDGTCWMQAVEVLVTLAACSEEE